jgi:hypothetical protein
MNECMTVFAVLFLMFITSFICVFMVTFHLQFDYVSCCCFICVVLCDVFWTKSVTLLEGLRVVLQIVVHVSGLRQCLWTVAMVEWYWEGNSEKNLSLYHFVHHKSHVYWPRHKLTAWAMAWPADSTFACNEIFCLKCWSHIWWITLLLLFIFTVVSFAKY